MSDGSALAVPPQSGGRCDSVSGARRQGRTKLLTSHLGPGVRTRRLLLSRHGLDLGIPSRLGPVNARWPGGANRNTVVTRTVGQDFAVEAPLLRPLPTEPFDDGLWLTPRVDRYSRVTVRQCHYSVPAALIGRNVRVSLRASELVIFDGRRQVARHQRIVRKGAQSLVLDHYLEVLVRKPRCPARGDSVGAGPGIGDVHRRARGVLGRGPRRARGRRQDRRHPHCDPPGQRQRSGLGASAAGGEPDRTPPDRTPPG